MKVFLTVFATVFLAEIGDKTQLATMLFASDSTNGKWLVFAAASLALMCAAGLGVLAGAALEKLISPMWLHRVAGIGFCAIGAWILIRA